MFSSVKKLVFRFLTKPLKRISNVKNYLRSDTKLCRPHNIFHYPSKLTVVKRINYCYNVLIIKRSKSILCVDKMKDNY